MQLVGAFQGCHVGILTRMRSVLSSRAFGVPSGRHMKQISLFQFIVTGVIAILIASRGFAQSGASYIAQRRIDTITVDGKFTEASWAGAVSTAAFTLWNGSPAPYSLQTSAKMVWDDRYLYIGFNARDTDVYATYKGRDVNCWEQDNFEVFVTVPGTTGYVEAEGSPAGAIWDGYYTNIYQGLQGSYNFTNLQIAAQVLGSLNNSADQDIGFTSEMRLPFSDIYQGVPDGLPTNGTQLRLNLNRINWNTPIQLGGPGATRSDTYYAWSPQPGNGPNFHQPDKFGTVTLSTASVPVLKWVFNGRVSSETNLVLSGIGHPGGTFCVLTTTNAMLAIGNWSRTVTNTFDLVSGHFRFTNIIASGGAPLYYCLRSP